MGAQSVPRVGDRPVTVTGLSGVYSDPKHVIAYDDGEVCQEFSLCFHARPVSGELPQL